jgi:hypothetical protein
VFVQIAMLKMLILNHYYLLAHGKFLRKHRGDEVNNIYFILKSVKKKLGEIGKIKPELALVLSVYSVSVMFRCR